LLGDLAAGQGRRDEARRRYEAVLQLTPLDRDVQDALARLTRGGEGPPRTAPGLPPAAAPRAGIPAAGETGDQAKQARASPEEPPTEPAVPPAAMGLATETLADLYAQQGFGERAAEIYRELLRQDPARADLREKLDRLEAVPPAPAAAEAPAHATGDGVALLERWREAARRRRGALRGGAA
ncbi:MAG TPA: hypothetical protein VFV36_11320, partial [Candidatus Methylomirabilis sp.]|nr:hypothetical protein [Candidatus Methylomirabilis sp.]